MQDQSQHSLKTGTVLNHYKIVRVLGAGGFGITYLAKDIELGLEVVIKEYFPNEFAIRNTDSTIIAKTSSDIDFSKGLIRFKEEAQVLAKFNHPSIVKILGYFEANQTAYFVMEYEEGMDLSQYMKKLNRPMTQEEILSIIMPILEGLKEVHNYNYLHRDIKPGNILLRNNHSPVLIDFGASKLAIGEASKSITSMLTEGYAPLEQYSTDIKQQGSFTDLYAIGAVIYKMITGNVPPSAQTRSYQLLSDDDDPLKSLASMSLSGYDKSFLHAVDRALSIKGKDRPQNVQEFQEDIAGRSIYKEEKDDDPKEKKKSNKGLIISLGLLIVLATGVLLFLFSQKQQSVPEPVVETKVQKAKAELNSTKLQPTITVTKDKINIKQPSSNKIENTSIIQWIFPSFENCINNKGSIVDGMICQASWKQAKEICKTIGGKLPSLDEFKQVTDDCNANNKTKKACYENRGFISYGTYWSSAVNVDYYDNAWNIDLSNGNIGNDYIDNYNYVSCVATDNNSISTIEYPRKQINKKAQWNKSIVENILYQKLREHGDVRTYGFDWIADNYQNISLKHEIVGLYDFPYSTGSHKLVIASSVPEKNYECHACAPALSFFEFGKVDGKWVLINSEINVMQMGSWGSAPDKKDFKIIKLGYDFFGIQLNTGGGGQGYWEDYIKIYSFANGKIKKIFDVQVGQDDSGAKEVSEESWKAVMVFDKTDSLYYKIVVKKRGIKESKSFDEKEIYVFNGDQYEKKDLKKKKTEDKVISESVIYKQWESSTVSKDMIKYMTHGTAVWGHEFGFIKKQSKCNEDLLWLTWSTTKKGLEKYQGEEVEFKIEVYDEIFNIRMDLLSVSPLTSLTTVAIFTNFQANQKFLDILKKGSNVSITIIGPDEIVKLFDMPMDEFDLNGFTKARIHADDLCNKLFLLNTPSTQVKNLKEKKNKYIQKNNLKLVSSEVSPDGKSIISQYIPKNILLSSSEILGDFYFYMYYESESESESWWWKSPIDYFVELKYSFLDNDNLLMIGSTYTWTASYLLNFKTRDFRDLGGGIAEYQYDGKNKGLFLLKGKKSYFKEGGAFWYDVLVNSYGHTVKFPNVVSCKNKNKWDVFSIQELIHQSGNITNTHIKQTLDTCIKMER